MGSSRRTTSAVGIVFVTLVLIGSQLALSADDEESHFRYGTLSWAPTGTPGEVEFRLSGAFRRSAFLFGRCTGVCPGGLPIVGDTIFEGQGPTQFNFGDGSPVTPTLSFLVTAIDTSSAVPDEHWVLGDALDPVTGVVGIRHTYVGAGPFTAFFAGFFSGGTACCRLGQFGLVIQNNRSGAAYPLQTDVTPLSGNSSPVSAQVPFVFVPQSANAQFLVAAADPDGDPIQWRLSTDAEAGGPSHPPGISINSSTGIVTWNNLALSTVGTWQVQVVVEDLDAQGNVKTKIPVDFLMKIFVPPPFPPTFDPPTPCGQTLTTVIGSPLTFIVAASDPEGTDTVTLNHGGLPSGSSFPIPPAANPVGTTFSWTPIAADVGVHVVIFTAIDNNGVGAIPCSVVIEVELLTQVAIDIKPGSDPNSINSRGKGNIPVAILSTDSFDASTVAPSTVRFGPNAAGIAHASAHLEDADGDGLLDLVLHFKTTETGIACGDTSAVLTGATFGGQAIEGSDAVRVVPCK